MWNGGWGSLLFRLSGGSRHGHVWRVTSLPTKLKHTLSVINHLFNIYNIQYTDSMHSYHFTLHRFILNPLFL